jgi:hypothetical protein
MKFLREMDLYKGLILLCLLALPVCGWWCKTLGDSIKECDAAIREANRPGGLLEQIGGYQKKIELVVQNRTSATGATQQPRTYFEGQIMAAASQNLEKNDFGLTDPKEETAVTGSSSRQKAVDFVAEVQWKRKDLALPLAFIYAVLFNCESGARPGGEKAGLQSIWKLRELSIVNATNERLAATQEVPPPELEDKWSIKKMTFARREPKRDTK